MRSRKAKNFIVPTHIYNHDVMFSVAETNQEFIKSISKKLPSSVIDDLKDDPIILNLPPTCLGRTIQLSTGQVIVRMPQTVNTCERYGGLAHEIFHAVTFLLTTAGMKLEVGVSDEAFAYLIGYVTTEVYKKI